MFQLSQKKFKMIKDLVKIANQNMFLKAINARTREKEKNIEKNKKRYWKLSASERLHYDSRVEKVKSDNSTPLLTFTFVLAKLYFYSLVIFTLFKVLFQVDPTRLVDAFLLIIGTAPLLFKIAFILDIIFIFLEKHYKRKGIESLNRRYGFKRI